MKSVPFSNYVYLYRRTLLVLFLIAGFFPGSRLVLWAQGTENDLLEAGETALHTMQWSEAKRLYDQTLESQELRPLGHVGIARIYIGQKRWAEALIEVDKAYDLAPDNKPARYYKAIIHRETAKFDVLQATKA